MSDIIADRRAGETTQQRLEPRHQLGHGDGLD